MQIKFFNGPHRTMTTEEEICHDLINVLTVGQLIRLAVVVALSIDIAGV